VAAGLWIIGVAAAERTGHARRQMSWVFWPAVVGFLAVGMNDLMWYRLPVPPVLNPCVSVFFISMAYAMIKHQLMDLRLVIRRSAVYSVLIACMTLAYLIVVLLVERSFQGFFGYRSVFATTAVAFLIAIFFNPLRNQIQLLVDRMFFHAIPAELAAQREQLLAQVRKAEQMKAVATWAAGLAHEIKNPLASIKTFTEYVDTRYADPAFRAKFQHVVGGEVKRISHVVQQLLDFAKPSLPKLTPLEVPRLLEETLDLLSGELAQRHVEATRSYGACARVLGDPQQLKQVFLNVLLNSLDAINGRGRVGIQTSQRGSELAVTIADNGRGISAKDLPRIFEPFFSTKATGTGLGLAVAQGIVREHGGRIEVKSRPGQGTQVRLYLPAAV
jgi:signal transduction histidine kinase